MLQADNKTIKSFKYLAATGLVAFFCIIFLTDALGADTKIENNKSQDITIIEKKEKNDLGLTAIPIFFYTPETKMAFGAGSLFTYRFGLLFKKSRPSTMYLGAVYTQMKQFSFQLKPEIYLKNNSVYLTGNFLAEKFPTNFWGIGPETTESDKESYTPQTYFLEIGYQHKLFSGFPLYFGLKYHMESTRIKEKEPGKLLDRNKVIGSNGGLLSGPGIILNFDSRDNIFSPSDGLYFQLFGFINDRLFGSDFNYISFKIDLRQYVPVGRNNVLAWQAIFDTCVGDVPFYKMPRVGGDSMLRGFYAGRFRDRNMAAFQTEFRFPIWKKLSGVVFGAMGSLSDRFRELSWDNLKYAGGFGLRFKVIPKENANLRVDFAFGPGTYGIYFKAGEAF